MLTRFSRSKFCSAFPFRCHAIIHLVIASCLILAACSSDSEQTADTSTTSALVETSDTTETTAATETDEAIGADEPSPVCGAAFQVVFEEGAPRDRMTISNVSEAEADFRTVSIDLTESTGKIIFDTTDGGEGVEVFQAFQIESGDAVLAADPIAVDGGSTLDLSFTSFVAGQSFTFSIDVDDQLEDSDLGQIQVTGAEIEGALIEVELSTGSNLTAAFVSDSTASGNTIC